jgi:hypothetical protein
MRKKENSELHERLKGRYKAMHDSDQENRRDAMEDMKFCFVPGEQWDTNMKQERGQRPCYEFNKVRISVKRVINDMRANRPSGKVRPVEGGDKKIAELYEGLIRNIANRSEFETVTDYAAEYQVAGGYSAWRIDVDYADDDIFEQDIWIRGIENPYCLWHDPSAKDFMKRDAEDWMLTERITYREFEKRFGKEAEKAEFEGADEFDDDEHWNSLDSVRVAEYWYKKPILKEIWQLEDGTVVDSESDEASGIPEEAIKARREVFADKICRVMASGTRLLTEPEEWAGRKFPFIVVYGEHFIVDGKTQWYGLVRHARDAQQSYNLARTSVIEAVAQQPKGKWWATPEQAAGNEQLWAIAHKKNIPWMPYNPDPQSPGPPQMMFPATVPPGLAAEQQFASDDLKAVTGIFDASIGARGNETSGRAIYARQQQGEIATFNYQDNMSKAVQYTYEIIMDLIPEIYDTERELRIIGSDGADEYMKVNQVVMDYESEPPRAVRVNDLSMGKYDVTVTTGPNFATQRQEAAETYTQLIQSMPDIMGVAGDLIFKSMDLPYSDEVAERLRYMLPPQVQQSLMEGEEMPPEVARAVGMAESIMQQVQEMMQQLQELEAKASEAKAGADTQQQKILTELEKVHRAKAEFDAHVANELNKLAQKEAQIVKREIDTDLGIPELRMALEQIGGSEQMSQQQIQALDQTLATFMQAVDQAVGVIQQRADQLDRAANKSVIAGTTRRENGQLVADVEYDDGTRRTVRAKRENGEFVILPPEADGEPESPA